MDEKIKDGWGIEFDPEAYWAHLSSVLQKHEEEQKAAEINRFKFPEPEWKDKPAGQYERGSGV